MSFWTGEKEKMMQVPTMTGGQTNLLNMLLGGLSGQGGFSGGPMGAGMQNLMDILSGKPEVFQKFEAPYRRQFEQQTIPSLTERFASMGSGGGLSSSAFAQQMGQAGAGLQEQLAAMHGNMQQGAMGQLSNLFGMGMGTKQFENIFRPRDYGFLGGIGQGIGQGLGMLPAAFMI